MGFFCSVAHVVPSGSQESDLETAYTMIRNCSMKVFNSMIDKVESSHNGTIIHTSKVGNHMLVTHITANFGKYL